MPIETWYVMTDGSVGDPREIAPGADGILRHRDGRAVEYRPHGPRSRGGIDPDAERAKAAAAKKPLSQPAPAAEPAPEAEAKEAAPARDRQVKAEGGAKTYKTR